MIYFTAVAIVLYVVSDWILRQIEIKRGELLPNRSVVFFIIITVLSVVSFSIIQSLYPKNEPAAVNTQPAQIQDQTQQQIPK